MQVDPEQEREWVGQINLAYSGLIGVGVVMVQPFLTVPARTLPAKICVIAFSVAIPLLAALVMVNRQEAFRGRVTRTISVEITRGVAQGAAFVGLVAGFWHILPAAGIGLLAAAIVGTGVHSAAYVSLEGLRMPRSRKENREPDDKGS